MATTKKLSEMSREVISIGINFAPIQIDLGDGIVWKFNSDPAPTEFGELQASLTAMGALGQAAERGEEVDYSAPLQRVSEALRGLLTESTQKANWTKKAYGMGTLVQLAQVYIPAIMGTPTK